tara:strand:+ start:1751 stop:2320 length:570 start_codon:yes stop_codon:yes gene_type:complete
MREFVDENRDIAIKYYDLCDIDRSTKKGLDFVKSELKNLIKEDPYFLDSYSDYYQVLIDQGDLVEARKVINTGYKNAMYLILDSSGNWPDSLEWGWIENRHIIRLLINKSIDEWSSNNEDIALELFRKLLKTNPRDNGGVRFYMLAILMGLSFDDYEEQFNKGGYYDDSSWNWFNKNYKKFASEFKNLE